MAENLDLVLWVENGTEITSERNDTGNDRGHPIAILNSIGDVNDSKNNVILRIGLWKSTDTK